MTRILLVRHGDTEYNNNNRFMGDSDIELSPNGRKQIELLRNYISKEDINYVFTSNLIRTISSGRILIGNRTIDLVPCPELREIKYGDCEGMTFEEITSEYPEVARQCKTFTPKLSFPEGEDFISFAGRVVVFKERINNLKAVDTVLVVSHMGPIKVLICSWLGIELRHWWQFRVDTASLSIMEIVSQGAILRSLNNTSFLSARALPQS